MKTKYKLISVYLTSILLLVVLASCASTQGSSHKFDLPFKNTVVNAKSGTFIVEPTNFKIRVWSPVNRTVGYVIQTVTVTDPHGNFLSLPVTGAGQLSNVAFVSIPITEDQSSLLTQQLNTKGTEVAVKLRIETFTYLVK